MYNKKNITENVFDEKEFILIQEVSASFDYAIDAVNGELLLELVEKEEKRTDQLSLIASISRFYSLATAYGELARFNIVEQDLSYKKQLFYFRKSLDLLSHCDKASRATLYDLERKLYTNVGNCLDHLGRKQSALESYYKAIELSPDFGMTLGEIGIALNHYAEIDYNENNATIYHYFAYHYLKKSIKNKKDIHKSALKVFQSVYRKYTINREAVCFFSKDLDFQKCSYDGEEKNYRIWALNNRLFLNPLNDLPIHEMCFARDVIQLPNMIVNINAEPIYHGLFNQIKQEYVYARLLCFESVNSGSDVHFADKETCLVELYDYTVYSIRLEKLKMSFRILYSILDKVSFFLNRYFDLCINDNFVNFKNIWRIKKCKNDDKMKNVLDPSQNIALKALCWISKDFVDKYEDSPNPHAKKLSDLRNALEHKYVKIVDSISVDCYDDENEWTQRIGDDEMYDYTLQLMKLIREIILNLSFAVYIEEERRYNLEVDNKIFLPRLLSEYDDEWKI